MNFLVNGLERRFGFDLNGDGYIGGQGFMGRLERATHIDFNGDNIIGRLPDVYPGYGYPSMYSTGYGGMMGPTAYGGFPRTGYGTSFGYY